VAGAALAMGLAGAAAGGELVLTRDGKSDYQIVTPDAAATPEVKAALAQVARLAQAAFKLGGQCDVAVVAEAQRDAAKPGIFLGDTAFARKQGVDVSKLEGWGYVMKAVSRDLIVAGRDHAAPGEPASSRRRNWDRIGTAKGVADFLRQFVGTRFLYPDIEAWLTLQDAAKVDFAASPAFEFLPSPTVSVPADLNVTKTPFLIYNIGYPHRGGFYDIANNRFPLVDVMAGAHTYERAVPVAKYYDTHPEYFALVGGQRVKRGQYCVSNPQFQELLFQDMISWLDRGFDMVDLGQPDGFQACQCAECAKLFGTGEDWSEKLWILHRNLAERVLKARPGKKVMMMSYILTAAPPKTFKAFPANTRIMLCGTNEDDIAPWKACVVPQGFTGYVYNWCPNLGSRYTPMRTPRYIEAQARRLAGFSIRGLYRDGPGSLYGLEGPVYYIMGRMFDDPQGNSAKELMQEFCGAAFGKSAPAMMAFYDRLYQGIELYAEFLGTRCPGWAYVDIYGRRHKYLNDPFQLLAFLYTPGMLDALEKDLARAEKAADTAKVKTRLALARREFDYLKALARVAHLHNAYQVAPDVASRDRLLDAIDARNALIATFYGKKGTLPGWGLATFPPLGHSEPHLRLAYNEYQGPFKDTCLNWDTKAMRSAPLPGSKRLTARAVSGDAGLEGPFWRGVAAEVLGGGAKAPRTTIQAGYDKECLLLRAECALAEAKAVFAPAGRDGDLTKQESLDIRLAPPGGRGASYRFMVGPHPESKYDAACGFITDVMDPRYGQDDAAWNGEWSAETRLEPDKKRWLALIRIPFKTLGVDAPTPGSAWRAGFGRVCEGAGKVERVAWPPELAGKEMDSRAALGDVVFEAKGAKPEGKSSLQEVREGLYQTTFEVPPEWKKLPDLMASPFEKWLFRVDPLEVGVKEGWHKADTSTEGWTPVRVPGFWAETEGVGNYQGFAWYRATFKPPVAWKGRGVRLLFGAADEQAWVYVNGELVGEHTEKSEGKPGAQLWDNPFIVEAPAKLIRCGEDNVLAVRVRNDLANGGLWRPVMVQGGK